MADPPEDCTIGKITDTSCHMIKYCRSSGYYRFTNIAENSLQLLEHRTGKKIDEDGCICFHHEKILLSKYEDLQTFCADPFKVHKKKVSGEHI